MKLYTYWRSSCSYRVRIALGLKGLAWKDVPIHLVKGEQRDPGYTGKNPSGLVPTLELPDGTLLTQSLAIIDYLEALHPAPPLIPSDPLPRARVLAAAHVTASQSVMAVFWVTLGSLLGWLLNRLPANEEEN